MPPTARSLRGDERLLTLVLKNLVDNALKFTTNGYVVIRSRRHAGIGDTAGNGESSGHESVGESAAAVVLEVQDTGCGIPLEDQQRVFERFYTVNRSRGGRIGAPAWAWRSVKHAVVAMGGNVQLVSIPGEGTTMPVHLPDP